MKFLSSLKFSKTASKETSRNSKKVQEVQETPRKSKKLNTFEYQDNFFCLENLDLDSFLRNSKNFKKILGFVWFFKTSQEIQDFLKHLKKLKNIKLFKKHKICQLYKESSR